MNAMARYRTAGGRVGFGLLEENRIVEYEGDLFEQPGRREDIPRETITLLSPCAPPRSSRWEQLSCASRQAGQQVPKIHPLFLIKPGSSVAVPAIRSTGPQAIRARIAYEGELGLSSAALQG